jgi:lysozyme family protein
MKSTYEQAITQVFKDEGGYTNDPHDPGGPTNWGITIIDARLYWKSDATAEDVKNMPKSVAEEIYDKHYATPLRYNDLPAGVDYAVLDYGINSGISRSAKVLQSIVGVSQDGIIGPNTIQATLALSPIQIINKIYDERLSFLKSLPTWSHFQHGWTERCTTGRALALSMVQQNKGQMMTTSNLGTTIVTDIADVTKAAQAIENVLPTVISIVGTFYAPINLVTPFLPLIQQALTAVNTVATQSGTDIATAIQDVVNTLTPGKPNAPALQ